MAKKKTWTVPLIKGTDIAWTEIWESYDVELDRCEPEDYKFDATIKFSSICKGYGSGCKVFVRDAERTYINKNGEEKPVRYGIFLIDADEIIPKMNQGILTATFTVCKRGQDYGIKLAD